MSDDLEDYDDHDRSTYDDEDEDDEYLDCGLMPDGQCLKAGSEDCDWECPMRNSEFYAGSEAWCRMLSVGDQVG